MIRAVVLDIGSVLEVIDESIFPGPWERRLGLPPGGFESRLAEAPVVGDPRIGTATEAEWRDHWRRTFGLDETEIDELMEDYWRWYVGTLDPVMFRWFAGLRPRFRAGLLSNSASGAREREACWGFEKVTDDIVYSHEVGVLKPDPAIYRITQTRIGVQPEEIVFVDDLPGNVAAAREQGWHAVVHSDAARSIADVEEIIAAQSAR